MPLTDSGAGRRCRGSEDKKSNDRPRRDPEPPEQSPDQWVSPRSIPGEPCQAARAYAGRADRGCDAACFDVSSERQALASWIGRSWTSTTSLFSNSKSYSTIPGFWRYIADGGAKEKHDDSHSRNRTRNLININPHS